MSDMQDAIKELSTALSEIALPKRFLEGYDQLECLAHSHATETYLVRQKGSNMLCIAKCYDRKSYKAVNESGILKTLRHEGLPAFVDEYEDDRRMRHNPALPAPELHRCRIRHTGGGPSCCSLACTAPW